MSKPQADRSRRIEWIAVGVMTFVGAVLRFWNLGRLGLTHFDEGIYASAGIWSLSTGGLAAIDPGVLAYAPPGFPILVGLSYLVFGVSDLAAILVSILAAIATIPLAAWLARRTFGSGAGIATATFTALSLAHVAFSRKALTDASFLATWLVAAGMGMRFLERPGIVRAIVMGLAVGLAQNFKYNGWLAGAVVIVAALLPLKQMLREPGGKTQLAQTFGFGAIGIIAAALAYLPWFQFVQNHGGYGALLAHQRSYMGGTSRWPTHLLQQLAQADALSGGQPWGVATWFVSLVLAAWVVRQSLIETATDPSKPPPRSLWASLVLAFWFSLGLGSFPALGLFGGGFMLVQAIRCKADAPAWRLLASVWIVLLVMTPFYYPYARLWLPLHALDWIVLGGLARRLNLPRTVRIFRPGQAATVIESPLWKGVALLVLVTAFGIRWPHRESSPFRRNPIAAVFEPTDTLRLAVTGAMMAKEKRPEIPAGMTLRVLGRRPIVFYLGALGRVPFSLMQSRDEMLDPPRSQSDYLLVDDVQIAQEGPAEEFWPTVLDRWRMVDSWEIPLDPVTLLDVRPETAQYAPSEEVPRLWLLGPIVD